MTKLRSDRTGFELLTKIKALNTKKLMKQILHDFKPDSDMFTLTPYILLSKDLFSLPFCYTVL